MTKFNPAFASTLAKTANKKSWLTAFNAGLGSDRIISIIHDANVSASDPGATGVEVYKASNTGLMTGSTGNIVNFGTIKNVVVQNAIDLATGAAVLRIAGNGNWAEFTLGLTGSGKEYTLSGNPTATSGLGFATNAKLNAPRYLASGTGPVAPTIKPTTPTIIELVDWTNEASPVVVGVGYFTERQDDFVFEDETLAAEVGDVAVYNLADTIKWTNTAPGQEFELGGLLLVASNYNTEDGVKQLEQMLLSFKPYQRWNSYPALSEYRTTNYTKNTDANGSVTWTCNNPTDYDSTFPPAFKINLYTETGYDNGSVARVPMYVHEIKAFYDTPALPINSPKLSNVFSDTQSCIPHFNCGQMLPWQNMRTKVSAVAGRYFNGIGPWGMLPTNCRDKSTSNGCSPPSINGQLDGINHWYFMPEYPMKNAYVDWKWDTAYIDKWYPKPADPQGSYITSVASAAYCATGWRYQPGSNSGHDQLTGMGGVRFDRAVMPTPIGIFMTNPNYVRPLGNTPIREMVDSWNMAYFNFAQYWVVDAKKMTGINKAESLAGSWTFARAYYGGGPYGGPGQPRGPERTINLVGLYKGTAPEFSNFDATGRMPWQGQARDSLHSYAHPAWAALLFNSPIHAIAERYHFDAHWMSGLGASVPNTNPNGADGEMPDGDSMFTHRPQAWRFLAYAMQWVVGAQHDLTYSRAEVEGRFQIELETLHDKVYVPAFVNKDPRPYFEIIRKFGSSCKADSGNVRTNTGSMGLYLTHALVMLKQTGLWSVMKKRNQKCKLALEMMLTCLDKAVIDYAMDTDMRDTYYPYIVIGKNPYNLVPGDIPADWTEQAQRLKDHFGTIPADTRDIDEGNYPKPARWINLFVKYNDRAGEQEGNCHMYYQYMKARQHYFPEYPHARLAAAITKVEGYYQQYFDRRAVNKAFRLGLLHVGHADLLPPTILGPN